MFGVALRKKWDDAVGAQTAPDRLGVIIAVA